jgi:hypothetical protein
MGGTLGGVFYMLNNIMDPRIHTKKIKILRNKINKLIYLNDNIV